MFIDCILYHPVNDIHHRIFGEIFFKQGVNPFSHPEEKVQIPLLCSKNCGLIDYSAQCYGTDVLTINLARETYRSLEIVAVFNFYANFCYLQGDICYCFFLKMVFLDEFGHSNQDIGVMQ